MQKESCESWFWPIHESNFISRWLRFYFLFFKNAPDVKYAFQNWQILNFDQFFVANLKFGVFQPRKIAQIIILDTSDSVDTDFQISILPKIILLGILAWLYQSDCLFMGHCTLGLLVRSRIDLRISGMNTWVIRSSNLVSKFL